MHIQCHNYYSKYSFTLPDYISSLNYSNGRKGLVSRLVLKSRKSSQAMQLRPCLHKHIFDLKRSCLDTFLPLVYTETSKNEYVPKTHFNVNTHKNTFTKFNTLAHLCINGTETLVVFVGWAFICHKNISV